MRNGGLRREGVDGKHGVGIGVADDRHVGGVDERFDAAAKERKAAGLLDLIGHTEGCLAQTPVDGQRLHGQKAVGSYGHLGLGKFVCKLNLGEVDRGDDVLVNLGGNIDGAWSFVAAGVSKELVPTKASTRSFKSLRESMAVRFYAVRSAVYDRRCEC